MNDFDPTAAVSIGNATAEEELRALLLGPEQLEIQRLRDGLSALSKRFDRPEDFSREVASILNDAFRLTPQADRQRLTDTLAVLITSPVRQEIKNAQPEILEALYPVADDLVAKGVRNAVAKLNSGIQERMRERFSPLESISVGIEALLTRSPASEVWLRRYPPKLEADVMLVNRQSGLPIAAADQASSIDGAPLNPAMEHLSEERIGVASMLSVLQTFAADSLNEGEAVSVRRIAAGGSTFMTESSPSLTLVARVKGEAPVDRDALLVRQFQALQRTWHARLQAEGGILADQDRLRLEEDLEAIRLELVEGPEVYDPVAEAKAKRRRAIGVACAGLFASAMVIMMLVNAVQEYRLSIIENSLGLERAYPIEFKYSLWRDIVDVTGIVATQEQLSSIEATLGSHFGSKQRKIDVLVVPPQ